jgi:hypothetical protein
MGWKYLHIFYDSIAVQSTNIERKETKDHEEKRCKHGLKTLIDWNAVNKGKLALTKPQIFTCRAKYTNEKVKRK